MMSRVLRAMRLVLLGGFLACASDSTGPSQRPDDEMVFLRFAGNAPPLESSLVTFWAVRGQNREGRVFFLDSEGERDDEFVRLKVDAGSLVGLPGGLPIGLGDSVLITIQVDPQRLMVTLLPAGLLFSSAQPAELRIRYDKANPDYNEDGVVDGEDEEVEDRFSIWRQGVLGGAWARLGSVRFQEDHRVEARLEGFSRYAISY